MVTLGKKLKGVNTPITMESPNKDYYIAIHEAKLEELCWNDFNT